MTAKSLFIRDDRGLDFAAAVHQLLKDAVEFVEVSVAGDEGLRLETAAGNQFESLAADGRGVMKSGAQRDVAVVDAIGVERHTAFRRRSRRRS